LEKAPSYSKDELETFGGDHYRETLLAYYAPFGATPYW
jgi:hypothetical protein